MRFCRCDPEQDIERLFEEARSLGAISVADQRG